MRKGFKSNFNFGGPIGESDPLLSKAYYDNGDFTALASPSDDHCFLIGRTGSGKSAALRHLEEQYPNKVLRIVPENLSLPYITNLDVVQKLTALGVRLDPFFKALWKHVIVVEIIKHRYQIYSAARKRSILDELKERMQKDPAKVKALDYVNAFGDKFWCETDERVKQIADTLQRKVTASGELNATIAGIGAKGVITGERTQEQQVQRDSVARFQRIVNEPQLPRLNEMINVINEEILDSKQHFTYLVIDDLDKDWIDESLANVLIRCLFQAVVDMQRVQHLKILSTC